MDMAHFFYIHYSFPVYFKNVFEGHVASQNMNTKPRPDVDLGTSYSRDDDAIGRSEAAYYGPSYMIDYLWSPSPVGELETVLINCHYPVSPTSFVLQWGAAVKKPESLTDEEATGIAQAFTKGVEFGFVQDVEIWRNKAKIDNPLFARRTVWSTSSSLVRAVLRRRRRRHARDDSAVRVRYRCRPGP